jgi:hypothetical protein
MEEGDGDGCGLEEEERGNTNEDGRRATIEDS